MARPSPELVDAAKPFICVRVTDLRTVDLARFRVDFDLTFAALTADADGNVRHRYGGRDARDPQSALSNASLVAFLEGSLAELAQPATSPTQSPDAAHTPAADAAHTIEDLPTFKKRDAEKRIDCVHCHTVNDFENHQAVADGTWRREQMWVYPDPARLGIEVDRDEQQRLARVEPGSPAAKAGLAPGDRIVTLNGASILTRADVQWQLQQLENRKSTLALEFERGGAKQTAALALADGWKACDPLEYAWRPYKWNLPPHPGFGGKLLTADEKQALGLDPGKFAQRVGYLVTWGEKADTGRNAEQAGLKKDDVVLSIGGKSDFATEDHVQAWYRITQEAGSEVELVVLRDGKRRTLRMKVID